VSRLLLFPLLSARATFIAVNQKMGSDNEPKMQANGMPDMDAKEKAGGGLVMLLAMIVIPLGIGFSTACAIHSYGNTSAYEKVVAFLSIYRSTQTHTHLHTRVCILYEFPPRKRPLLGIPAIVKYISNGPHNLCLTFISVRLRSHSCVFVTV
jgi:hypothetical protein